MPTPPLRLVRLVLVTTAGADLTRSAADLTQVGSAAARRTRVGSAAAAAATAAARARASAEHGGIGRKPAAATHRAKQILEMSHVDSRHGDCFRVPIMSHPREIAAGATYLLTRRVLRRHLLLRPDAAINQLLVYVLAVSARRYGVEVHALCAMSTHLHLVVTDVQGVLPRFLQFFHRIVALGTKVLREWEGPVWDHEATSVVRLLTPTAIVEKIAYVLANPVAAGLVRHATEWPGAKVDVGDLGRGVLRATRPSVYLDPENPQWTEEVALPLTLPPAIEQQNAEGFRRQVAAEIERLEAQAHAEVERQGLRFLGAEQAGKVSPHARAMSTEERRGRNPTFAVGREQGDAWRAAAAAVRAFRVSYRAALERWRAGVRSAVFPVGTWWMRIFHGASVSDDAVFAV